MIVTIEERKARKVAQLRAAFHEAATLLKGYAVAHGGRFLVFGSFARDDIRFDSDFDVALDFDASRVRDAGRYVEEVCARFGVMPDIHVLSDASPGLRARIERNSLALP